LAASAAAMGSVFIFRTREVLQLGFVGNIRYWRGNDILSTGPFTQINQPASLTAERKVLARALHGLFANGAFKLGFFSHTFIVD
jgi:hypothetical protein